MSRKAIISVVLLLLLPAVLRAGTVVPLQNGWRLQSACKLNESGDVISSIGFSAESWLKTAVPATVLAAQAAAGEVPDPYFGLNLRHLPGVEYPVGAMFSNLPMPENSPYRCGWWYRDEFDSPLTQGKDGRVWLHFGGINYRADIWLNGKILAKSNSVAGAYRTYDFDVTEYLQAGKTNVIAVETFAPTEKNLGINWVDWNPCPPDKDMGLWGEVNLTVTGAVTVKSPMAVTHFLDRSLKAAQLTVYGELRNASDRTVHGIVIGHAAGVRIEQRIELAAHEMRTIEFTPEKYPELQFRNPKPWWPIQMGDPHLEHLNLSFQEDGYVTDEQNVEFGFREITSELTVNGARLFRVNGKPILIRGGGWSQDMMLRTDDARLREQFRMVHDLNLNTIRLEGKMETEEFFRLADKQGILVMAGWCCCDHWEHWKDWTAEDLSVATDSLRSQMLRFRHHASLLAWLNGSDNPPTAAVERAYLQVESEVHWPNPVVSSASAESTTVSGESGVKMTGPYDYVAPSYWYVDQHHGGAFGFNTETSPGPAIPSLASREKFLSDPLSWPPSEAWSLHYGEEGFTTTKVLDAAMEATYAKPRSAVEYERLASTMEYDSERAMFEAYSKNKYTTTGVIQWMLNNAWPSVIWHLYDYYLDAGAGYFATKKACEPVHIQYSYDDRSIVVVNSTYEDVQGLMAKIEVHGMDWKKLYSSEKSLSASADSAQRVATIPESLYSGAEKIFFIDLVLSDQSGRIFSHNFYWVPGTLTTFAWDKTDYTHTPALRHENMTALASLPQADVEATARIVNTPEGREVRVHLNNRSAVLAFQLHVATRTASGGLVAPVLWSDNWVELVPGASTTLTALMPKEAGDDSVIQMDGWNVASITIHPTLAVTAK